jgi:hypothetical protein
MTAVNASTNPATRSAAYAGLSDVWKTINDILAGPAAVRAAGERYLPKYAAEAKPEYERRLKSTPWRPEFVDILNTLSSKPFSKDVALKGAEPSERMKAHVEDVDKKGNNLSVFAREVFRGGIAKREHGILVDFPATTATRTKAQEKAAGVAPYWVSIAAEDILACLGSFVGGREVVTYLRIQESVVERDGPFGEVLVSRIRVIEPRKWEVWEKRGTETEYKLAGSGKTTMDEVPFVRFCTGPRPPLEAIADMQMELYRALSRQEEILTYAGSPMLSAQGIAPPEQGSTLEIGPKRVLFAPPGVDGAQTGWSYIQPDAANLKEIRDSVQTIIDDIRRLGMQPLTQRTGGVTATATSVEAAKAHSAVEAWALTLKDALEQALVFTARWMGEPETVEVDVNTDFSVEPYAQAPLDALEKARKGGDLSQRTYWDGLRRFNVLSPDFDAAKEEQAIIEETPDEDDETERRNAA